MLLVSFVSKGQTLMASETSKWCIIKHYYKIELFVKFWMILNFLGRTQCTFLAHKVRIFHQGC